MSVLRTMAGLAINALRVTGSGSSAYSATAGGVRRASSAVPKCRGLSEYVGVAPVTERSGNKCWVHWRYSCSTFLRQSFVEWVPQTITRSYWAKSYYEAYRARGGSYQMAMRALAFKWIRVLYRCWVDRVPYDESRYLMALQRRQAPLLKHAASATS